FGHRAHRPGVAARRHRGDVTDLDRVGQADERGLFTVGKPDRRRGAAARHDDADAPVEIADADVGRGQLLGQIAVVGIDRRDRPVPGPPAGETYEPGAQRVARGALHFSVERGADPQPAGVNAVRPIFGLLSIAFDETAPDFFEEVARVGRAHFGL